MTSLQAIAAEPFKTEEIVLKHGKCRKSSAMAFRITHLIWWQQIPSRFHPNIMQYPLSEDPQFSHSKLAYRLPVNVHNIRLYK